MNILTEVRQAVCEALKGSLPLVEFMEGGKWFTLESGDAPPTKLSKDDCPALIIMPGGLPGAWEDVSYQLVDYVLAVTGYIYGDVAKAEEFFMLIYQALMAAYPDLGQGKVKRFRIAGLKFHPHFEEGLASYWQMSFDLVLSVTL